MACKSLHYETQHPVRRLLLFDHALTVERLDRLRATLFKHLPLHDSDSDGDDTNSVESGDIQKQESLIERIRRARERGTRQLSV